MNRGFGLLCAAGLGAGLMYFLDPILGRRRRGLLRDKVRSTIARADELIAKAGRDVAQRVSGMVAETSAMFRNDGPIDDDVLAARVRSMIGRACSHPSSIHVTAHGNRIILGGQILAEEATDVVRAASRVRGVSEVENQLQVHEEPGNVSGLQGEGRRPGNQLDLLQSYWAPTTRLLATTAGGALMANCLIRRTPLAALLGTLGFGLFLRGITNLELRDLIGVGQGRGIRLQKTIHIDALVNQVFEFWNRFENFPKFMTHVREVRDLGNGRSRWTVDGPAHVPIQWEAVVTRSAPNELLAWESVPGSPVRHSGVVSFQPSGDSGTRIQVTMSYIPPAGLFGHAFATLCGADPKQEMDDDLMRMKTFLETGVPPHDAAQQNGLRKKHTTSHRMRFKF